MYDMEAVGKRLISLRKNLRLTQEKVAEDMNISKYTLSRVENGKIGMSIDMIIVICEYYKCSLDYLLLGRDSNDYFQCVFYEKLPIEKADRINKAIINLIYEIIE